MTDTSQMRERALFNRSAAARTGWHAWPALLALAPLLAGCGLQEEAGAIVPGIYDVSQAAGPDGTLVVGKDGTYSDMEDNVPKPVDKGTWRYDEGRFCLESTVKAASLCFAETVSANGAVVLTANGQTITLTPQT